MTTKRGPKGWKVDTGKEGHRILFTDYQKAIIDNLIKSPNQIVTYTSAEMDESLKKQGIKISRASIIFYMNFLVDDGLATYEEKSGKGGYHRVYDINKTWDGVKQHIVIKVITALANAIDETPLEILGRLE